MSLTYTPDPVAWVEILTSAPEGWALDAAKVLATAQGGSGTAEQFDGLAGQLIEAQAGAGEADARWAFLPDLSAEAIIIDIDMVDLGDDVPTDIDVDDEASGEMEEFSAGLVHGKRIIWVSRDPNSPQATDEALLAQVMYVGTVTGSGYLVTMRSGQHHLEQIVGSVAACEQLLATMQV